MMKTCILLLLAHSAVAKIWINEVQDKASAYSGCTADDEWIELYNDGGAVFDFDAADPKYVLYDDKGYDEGGFILTGTIAAGGYKVVCKDSNGFDGQFKIGGDDTITLTEGELASDATDFVGATVIDSFALPDTKLAAEEDTSSYARASDNAISKTSIMTPGAANEFPAPCSTVDAALISEVTTCATTAGTAAAAADADYMAAATATAQGSATAAQTAYMATFIACSTIKEAVACGVEEGCTIDVLWQGGVTLGDYCTTSIETLNAATDAAGGTYVCEVPEACSAAFSIKTSLAFVVAAAAAMGLALA